jgi:hypothetical protein
VLREPFPLIFLSFVFTFHWGLRIEEGSLVVVVGPGPRTETETQGSRDSSVQIIVTLETHLFPIETRMRRDSREVLCFKHCSQGRREEILETKERICTSMSMSLIRRQPNDQPKHKQATSLFPIQTNQLNLGRDLDEESLQCSSAFMSGINEASISFIHFYSSFKKVWQGRTLGGSDCSLLCIIRYALTVLPDELLMSNTSSIKFQLKIL